MTARFWAWVRWRRRRPTLAPHDTYPDRYAKWREANPRRRSR